MNLLLALAILLGPVAAQLSLGSALRDCCQGDFCCENCCWFVDNCSPGEPCIES